MLLFNRRSRLLRYLIGGALVLALAATAAVVMFIRGTGGVDDWVVRQVVGVANTYLVPEIEFEAFDYASPGVLAMSNATLTSPDGTEVLRTETLRVRLAEVPRRGRPIKIEAVTLERPSLRLIREPGADQLQFRGLVPFVEPTPIQKPEAIPEERRLSNVLRIRDIAVTDASLEYVPGGDQPPMVLEDLDFALDVEPTQPQGEDGPLWHSISLDFDREPIAGLTLDGSVSLDTFVAKIDSLAMSTRVGPETYPTLPPPLQKFLREHDAHGRLNVEASGTAELRDWRASELKTQVRLEDFNIAAGEYRLPIDQLTIPIELDDGRALLSSVEGRMLDGTLGAQGVADLQASHLPMTMSWQINDMELRELLRTAAPPDQLPELAGLVSSSGEASGGLLNIPESLQGAGTLKITQGRLVKIPIVSALAKAADVFSKLTGGQGLSDSLDVQFNLTSDGIEVTSLDLNTPAIAARGSGMIFYDARLDLALNAGPLERVQNLLGGVGKIIGAVTDRVLKYRIRGTVAEPKVSVHPLGIGSAPQSDSDSGEG